MNRSNAVYLIGGIVAGILLMVLFNHLQPEPPKTDDTILIKSIEQRDKKIDQLKSENEKLTILASKEKDTVVKIQKEYVTIYKSIDHSNRADLDRAFDSLLTD